MDEMRVNISALDDILFRVASVMKTAEEIGWLAVPYFEEKELEIDYLNYLMELIKSVYSPELIAYLLDCEYAKILANHKPDIETIEKLLIIKHLAYSVQDFDYYNILSFTSRICTGKTKNKLPINLQ